MKTWTIKKDSTSPMLLWKVVPEISGIGAIGRFLAKDENDVVVIDAPAVIYQENPLILGYVFTLTDTAIARILEAEFKITFADGSIERSPIETNFLINIQDNVKT